jgi:hypothetical protein
LDDEVLSLKVAGGFFFDFSVSMDSQQFHVAERQQIRGMLNLKSFLPQRVGCESVPIIVHKGVHRQGGLGQSGMSYLFNMTRRNKYELQTK